MTLMQAYALFRRQAPRLGFMDSEELMDAVCESPRRYSEALQEALLVIQIEAPCYDIVE